MQMIYIILLKSTVRSTTHMNRMGLMMLMICSQAVLADSDLVNERLTTSTHYMEDHWNVDCEATLNTLAALQPGNDDPGSDKEIALALEKCAYIHQPPGDADRGDCNDYAALWRAWKQGDTVGITTQLENSARCRTLKEFK